MDILRTISVFIISSVSNNPIFQYLASIFIVFIAINKNINHIYLSFSQFLLKLVNGNQFSSADMAEIRSAGIELNSMSEVL